MIIRYWLVQVPQSSRQFNVEGYVLHAYGPLKYLRHAVAAACTIRRFDRKRPIALYASDRHIETLREKGLESMFDVLERLPVEHHSIVGFKLHLEKFKPYDRCLYLDSDIVWCRDPDPLWTQLKAFPFTATGLQRADFFFGGPKGIGVLVDVVLNRRRTTMRRFGLTYLPRVQAGMIYADDDTMTDSVMSRARHFLSRRSETHFRSRLDEGRSEESCEWSLAMAMSKMDLAVFDWFQGQNSPQLDYVDDFVDNDRDFREVRCLYFNDAFVHDLRGIPSPTLRKWLVRLFSAFPGKGDHMWVTPFVLHFGWLRYKQPFYDLADRIWTQLTEMNGDGADRLLDEPARMFANSPV